MLSAAISSVQAPEPVALILVLDPTR
jgi:hypothetical protein